MRCQHCNYDTPDDSSFCVSCHAPLVSPSAQTQAQSEFPVPGFASAVTAASSGPSAPMFVGVGLGTMPAGFIFGSRYRIDRLLGAGGMGAVYQAWDQELGLAVALKVIRPDIVGTPAWPKTSSSGSNKSCSWPGR